MDQEIKTASPETPSGGILLKEPLIPFAIIGGLLFVIYGFARPTPVEVIEVTPQTLQALDEFEKGLSGIDELTVEQRQKVLESYVEDEVLMREALRQGLERKDSRVRKRLLAIMRSTLDEQVPEPARNELRAYYDQNAEKFAAREVIAFDDVFFGLGNDYGDAEQILKQLTEGANPAQMGDSFWSSTNRRSPSRQDLLPTYGLEFTNQLFGQQPGKWIGPLESNQGTHFVMIHSREVLPAPTFEEVEEYLEQEWMFNRRREIQQKKIDELRKDYRVVFTDE